MLVVKSWRCCSNSYHECEENKENKGTQTDSNRSASPYFFRLTLASAASSTVTLDFYACAATNLSGVDASRRYLGAMTVTTDCNGNAAFSDFLKCLTSGEKITATATDAYGNTSAFSSEVIAHTPPVLVTPPPVTTESSEIDMASEDAVSQ
jgi:hypothetical protein